MANVTDHVKSEEYLGLDQMPTCVFCRKDERRGKESISCQECYDFIGFGRSHHTDAMFFRIGSLLTACHLGLRGNFAREVARDLEKQRQELWGV